MGDEDGEDKKFLENPPRRTGHWSTFVDAGPDQSRGKCPSFTK